jgi:hypothetical protein
MRRTEVLTGLRRSRTSRCQGAVAAIAAKALTIPQYFRWNMSIEIAT